MRNRLAWRKINIAANGGEYASIGLEAADNR
jgi:hypothetical protein